MKQQVADFFGQMGCTGVQIGSTTIKANKPATKAVLKGHGETVREGDVVFIDFFEGKQHYVSGPEKIHSFGVDPNDPWFMAVLPDGSMPHALVHSPHNPQWRREFRKADEATTLKLNNALQFHGLYVRVYVNFQIEGIPDRPMLVPACWIVWIGDVQKAIMKYDSPFGKIRKKDIVRWVKNRMFTDFTMKSKVPIPANFPVPL